MTFKKTKFVSIFIFSFFLFISLHSLPFHSSPAFGIKEAHAREENLTTEELLKTEASRLFLVRQFDKALKEFQKLERQYPKDTVIKRYIGACLVHLGRDDEAITQFQKVIQLNPNDFPSRQLLSQVYLKKGQVNLAEQQIKFLVENDKSGVFADPARAQLENIKQLQKTESKVLEAAGRKIAPREFLETKAVQHFMKGQYEEALSELKNLEAKYPGDPLVIRYQALALQKLGRLDEAIETLRSALASTPDNIALHYFLAQMLLQKQDYQGAKKEYEYVVANDESEAYRIRARADLKALEQLMDNIKRAKKKLTFDFSNKLEWIRNPGSSPRHIGFRSGRAIYSAGKISNTVGLGYRLFKKGAWTGKVNYNYSQSLYTRSFSYLNTFQNSGGGSITYSRPLFGRPLLIDVGQNTAHTMLREQYYTTSFTESASVIYSYWNWHRLIFSERWGFTTYDGDGTNPDMTSRDGFGNTAGMTHYLYHNKKKNFYSLLGFEYGYDITQGANYHKDEFVYRGGLHFPLVWRTDFDLAFKFKATNYPKYGFPLSSPGRRDAYYNFATTLSRPILRSWMARLIFDYTNVKSRDDNFTYINYSVAGSIAYSY